MSSKATSRQSSQQRKPSPEGGAGHKSKQKETEEKVDEQLDHELEDSFPASDPPSLTQDPK